MKTHIHPSARPLLQHAVPTATLNAAHRPRHRWPYSSGEETLLPRHRKGLRVAP